MKKHFLALVMGAILIGFSVTSEAEIVSHNDSALVVLDEIKAKDPELVDLILGSDSIDDEQKQYWLDAIPTMTDEQRGRIFDILMTEKQKLAKLNLLKQKRLALQMFLQKLKGEKIDEQEFQKNTQELYDAYQERVNNTDNLFDIKDKVQAYYGIAEMYEKGYGRNVDYNQAAKFYLQSHTLETANLDKLVDQSDLGHASEALNKLIKQKKITDPNLLKEITKVLDKAKVSTNNQ